MTAVHVPDLRAARRRLLLDSAGIAVSAAGFGFVFGLAARNASYSPIEVAAMSVIVFAGAAQFAAVGYVAAGLPWAPIVLLTFLLNARHLLYSASLAPRLRGVPILERAAMAHILTDEAFALSAAHFQRLGRVDVPGYWIAAIVATFIPWNVASLAGVLLGGAIADPAAFGLDVVFPAAMGGLAVGLVTGRREVAAAAAGAAIGLVVGLALGPAAGIVAGGVIGPLIGMAVPAREIRLAGPGPDRAPGGDVADAGVVARIHALPPMPFGRIDVDRALDADDEGGPASADTAADELGRDESAADDAARDEDPRDRQ